VRVLITRPRADAERTAERVRALGHEPVLAPLIRIVPTGSALPARMPDAILATSRNAVEAIGSEVGRMSGIPFFAVGPETAAAARAAGFDAVTDGGGSAAKLAGAVLASYPAGARLLYIAGRPRKPHLEAALSGDHVLEVVEVYRSVPAATLSSGARSLLAAGGGRVAVLHASRNAADVFIRLADEAGAGEGARLALHLVVSEDAAEPLRRAGCREIRVASRPTPEALPELLPTVDARRGGPSPIDHVEP
jgi:uroporphyrinogen-III synthase